jgi:hypothetical protein
MSFDEDFYKKLMKMFQEMMTPEGQKKIRDFIKSNPNFMKNNPFFTNVNPEDLQKFFDFINKNPNIKINFGAIPGANFPFQKNMNVQKDPSDTVQEPNVQDAECFWIGNEYHIILNYPEDTLKFKTAIHKKDKNRILLLAEDSDKKIIKRIKIPPTVSYKNHKVNWNNGVYEIVYQKK